MKSIVKYKVERPFKDKYTKQEIKENDIIEVTVERMKELNKKSVGRVVDIIIEEDTDKMKETQEDASEKNNSEADNEESEQPSIENKVQTKFVREELEAMTVNQLKDLAEKNNIELTKARKPEIIDELMKN